jgi:hypothetical protein
MTSLIFSPEHIEKIRNGKKTMTRRVVKDGETCESRTLNAGGYHYNRTREVIDAVLLPSGRDKWRVGETVKIKPGRNKKAVACIEIIKLGHESLQDMLPIDAILEGCSQFNWTKDNLFEEPEIGMTHPFFSYDGDEYVRFDHQLHFNEYAVSAYRRVWDAINEKRGNGWCVNPKVWVIEFQYLHVPV